MQIDTWAALLIDQLVAQGIHYFVVAPGSRSTPLVLAIAERKDITTVVHFDERGAAFHALGVAKATNKPAAVVVTSGTAVANLLPAIMEASYASIPLLLLTADRPPELRECGANQTVDQVKIFSAFVRWQYDLPCPSSELPAHFLRTIASQSYFHMMDAPKGPVQLNCMFRKPLLSHATERKAIVPSVYAPTERRMPTPLCQEWAIHFNQAETGVILLGSLPYGTAFESIYRLAQKLKWPILADITSHMRSLGRQEEMIERYEELLKEQEMPPPALILHLGDKMVSKSVEIWLSSCKESSYFAISEHLFKQDALHLVTHRAQTSPSLFCEQIEPFIESKSKSDYLTRWQKRERKLERSTLSESSIIHSLEEIPPTWALFVGNSMPIRYADALLFPQKTMAPLFANRGVSGIDGNIATAIGIAAGLKRPVIALLGDLTFLHDLNSLALLRETPFPLLFIIINNQGGAIFSSLPGIPEKPCFERFFAGAHPFSFEHAASLFQLAYHKPLDIEEYLYTLKAFSHTPESTLIEVQLSRGAPTPTPTPTPPLPCPCPS